MFSLDDINSLEYLEIIPLFSVNYDYIFGKIEWESISFVSTNDVTIQPPPLCGPTNINSSVMVSLENGIVYIISIQQRACSQEITTSFSLDCPLRLNIPVMKFTIYTNGTMTALTNNSEIITCINGVWPTNTICKNDKIVCCIFNT